MLGAVVGKALEPLNKGTGVIQVLVPHLVSHSDRYKPLTVFARTKIGTR
jgi:hypothetical protein